MRPAAEATADRDHGSSARRTGRRGRDRRATPTACSRSSGTCSPTASSSRRPRGVSRSRLDRSESAFRDPRRRHRPRDPSRVPRATSSSGFRQADSSTTRAQGGLGHRAGHRPALDGAPRRIDRGRKPRREPRLDLHRPASRGRPRAGRDGCQRRRTARSRRAARPARPRTRTASRCSSSEDDAGRAGSSSEHTLRVAGAEVVAVGLGRRGDGAAAPQPALGARQRSSASRTRTAISLDRRRPQASRRAGWRRPRGRRHGLRPRGRPHEGADRRVPGPPDQALRARRAPSRAVRGPRRAALARARATRRAARTSRRIAPGNGDARPTGS